MIFNKGAVFNNHGRVVKTDETVRLVKVSRPDKNQEVFRGLERNGKRNPRITGKKF
jgi:hypothetical protein